MIKDNIKLSGNLRVAVYTENGELKNECEVSNLVVDAGLDFIASRMTGTSSAVMSHMAIGSDDTAADAGDTALGSELGRVTLDSATVTDNAIAYVATFPAGTGTGAVTEAGLFNDATTGDMLCRTVFSVINKAAGDSMVITWTVTVSA